MAATHYSFNFPNKSKTAAQSGSPQVRTFASTGQSIANKILTDWYSVITFISATKPTLFLAEVRRRNNAGYICNPFALVDLDCSTFCNLEEKIFKSNMPMKPVFIVCSVTLTFLCTQLFAQQTANVIPAAGGNATSAGGSVSYSVGQIVYTSNTNGTAFVNQGVQSAVVNLILPVTLIDFSGSCTGQAVQLNWTTASETNNKSFTVERSSDGSIWTGLGNISGAGTSALSHQYTFTDAAPTVAAAYYRLKQTDINGVFEYSAVVYVKSCGSDKPSISLYPNPTAQGVYLNAAAFAGMEYKLYDLSGRLLSAGKMTQAATYIQLQGVSKSTYLLKVTQNNITIETFKILKN